MKLEMKPESSYYEATELTTVATCHPQSHISTSVVWAKKSSFEQHFELGACVNV